MEKISEHMSYAEATHTNYGIENIPNEQQLANIKVLADKVFEPLRQHRGGPIRINSVFRCEALEMKIANTTNSQHCAKRGAAMDIVITKEEFKWVQENLEFDQLIYEGGNDKQPGWVHISYNEGHNRNMILRMKTVNGKSVYMQYSA